MWINSRLASKLSESYANGDMSRSFGGNYTNSYLPNTFNNFAGEDRWISNQNEGVNRINSYSGNPDGLLQQQRFNEIANQVLNQQQELSETQTYKANNGVLQFADTLAQPFNTRNYVIPNNTPPAIAPQATVSQLNDINSQRQHEIESCHCSDMPNNTETFVPYSMERKFHNGTLTNPLMDKNTTMIMLTVLVIGFILFMLVQLYMSQKRLEYMVSLYRDVPARSLYYNTERMNNESYD